MQLIPEHKVASTPDVPSPAMLSAVGTGDKTPNRDKAESTADKISKPRDKLVSFA